jgi:hypothetical protein
MTVYSATLRGYAVGDGQAWEWTTNPQLGFGEYRAERSALLGRHGTVATSGDWGGATVVEWGVEYHHPEISGSLRPRAAELAGLDLRAAWRPHTESGLLELALELHSGPYVYRGRPLRPSVLTDEFGAGIGTLRFDVIDPLLYSGAQSQAAVAVTNVVVGGFDTPLVTPLVTTSSGSLGDASVFSFGTADAPWTAQLFGPLTDPRIILNGQSINMTGSIPAGSILLVDSRTGRVTLDGAMRPWVLATSTWWDIPPGSSTFSLRAAAGTGSAVLTWRDAFY